MGDYFVKKIKTYLLIILISVVFSLYTFEAYLTISIDRGIYRGFLSSFHVDKKIKLYKQQTGKDYDTRKKSEIYYDLKKEDENVVVNVYPKTYITKKNKLYPLSGISNSKTINCNENGYYSIYQSDRYGFNNPDSEWDKKEIEYLLVGDSFTHGACVNRPNDIASVLRILSKKAILNLGYGANGSLVEYATLREYLKPNVKNVLWLFYHNDIIDLDYELNSEILISYLKDLDFSQNLKFIQKKIDNIEKNEQYNEFLRSQAQDNKAAQDEKDRKLKNKFLKFIRLNQVKNIFKRDFFTKKDSFTNKDVYKNLENILKLVKELSIKNNSNFYFVYLPELERYKSGYDNNLYNQVKKIVEELNIPFIDIHKEVFKKESNPLKLFPFELEMHYNVEGYRKVAGAIYKFISK